jgi:hypothetical protein
LFLMQSPIDPGMCTSAFPRAPRPSKAAEIVALSASPRIRTKREHFVKTTTCLTGIIPKRARD